MSSQLNILCYDMLIIQLKRFNSTALLEIVKKKLVKRPDLRGLKIEK